jgi:2-deoxy-D-gluconate 3-dehydrogenase
MILEAFELHGKNALVTGSDKGLGAGIALALAEAGANIAFHSRGAVPQELCERVRGMGRKAIHIAGDLADSKVCSRLIEKTIEEFGSLDILVNNAGLIRRAPAVEFSETDWQEVIAVDLTAVFHLCRLAGKHMIERGVGGKIVNIASVLSFQGGVLVPA